MKPTRRLHLHVGSGLVYARRQVRTVRWYSRRLGAWVNAPCTRAKQHSNVLLGAPRRNVVSHVVCSTGSRSVSSSRTWKIKCDVWGGPWRSLLRRKSLYGGTECRSSCGRSLASAGVVAMHQDAPEALYASRETSPCKLGEKSKVRRGPSLPVRAQAVPRPIYKLALLLSFLRRDCGPGVIMGALVIGAASAASKVILSSSCSSRLCRGLLILPARVPPSSGGCSLKSTDGTGWPHPGRKIRRGSP